MKIGEYKFKRKYSAARIIVDIASIAFIVVIVVNTFSLINQIEYTNSYLNRTDIEYELMSWKPLIIWIVAAGLLTVGSVIYTYVHKKLPKRYVVDETNVRKYCDIIDTAVSCIRLIALFAVFELECIHYENLAYIRQSWVSVSLLCDVFFILVLWRFTVHRLRGVSIKPEERELTITED